MRSKQDQIDSSFTSDSSSHHTSTKESTSSGFSPSLTFSTSNSSSASLLAECRALQQDELIALQSIYTSKDQFSVINSHNLDFDSQSSHSDLNFTEPKLRLSIPINFPNTRKVRITSFHTSSRKSSSNLDSQSKLDPTQVANADPAQSQSSTSIHSLSASSSTKQVGPNGIDVISEPSRISTHSSISKGEPKSIDAHLAKEARRSITNQDQVTKNGNIDVEVSESDGKMSSRGNGKGKNGRKTNGKRGNSSAATKSQHQAPWELRAQSLADSTSSTTGISNSKGKSHQSKVVVIAGISNSSSSDSTSSSSLTSTSNSNRSSEANLTDERKYLNPNARPFSSSVSTTSPSSIASTSTSTQDAIVQNPSSSTQPSDPNLDNEPIPTSQIIEVSNLPPITLYLSLPSTYPLESPPGVMSLSSPFLMERPDSSSTPSHVSESQSNRVFSSAKIKDWIQNKLLESWEETKSESLYHYGEYLAEGLWKHVGDGNPFFGDGEDSDDRDEGIINFSELVSSDEELTSDSETAKTSALATRLIEYDKAAQSETFSTLSFTCSICLESRRGSKCFQIKSCSHVFCLECLKDYFTMMIIEGFHLQASRCPDVECVKRLVLEEDEETEKKRKEGLESDEMVSPDQTEAKDLPMGRVSSHELLELLGPQLHSRYLWLIKKSLLESNPTASNCPRQGCDGISIRRKEDAGTRFENFRTCEICSFNWCGFCKKTWHGFTPCKLKNSMELVDEFLSHPEGSLEREKLYKKFGKKNLDRLVKETVEEKANLQYLDMSTTQCPHCQIRIEKSAGCNHMTCFCCQSHFCYLCQQRLNPREPYRHFNTPNTPCFQKLFEGALPTGMGADGQLLPGFEGIAMEGGGVEEEEDWDERNFPARLIQEMMRNEL